MAQIRRRQLKSGISYEVRIHRAGHPGLSKSFRSHADARAWAVEVESRINKGETVNRTANKATMAEVCQLFADDYRSPRTGLSINEREKQRLHTLKDDLGEYSVGSLDHELIKKYLERLLATEVPPDPRRKTVHRLYQGGRSRTYSPSTVRKTYYQLKKVVEWHARKHGYLLDPHLFEGQAIPNAWTGVRSRRLVDGEEMLLYMSAMAGYTNKDESVRIIGFAIETAMRAQEILLARRRDLNLQARTLFIPKEHSKTDTARSIPLSTRAVEILNEQLAIPNNASERIFWQWENSDQLSKHFRRICHRASITDLKFHDLRHEATSRFFEAGRLSDMEIMKITGHTQYSTLQRYVNLRPSDLVSKMG